MLIEKPCRQILDEPPRRWIYDDYFDLIVWGETADTVVGFQLCYDKQSRERALTWKRDKGCSHMAVHGGESSPFGNCTPILVPDGEFPAEAVTRQFLRRSAGIDSWIRNLVLEKIAEYSDRLAA
jgi:hypothetical protein